VAGGLAAAGTLAGAAGIAGLLSTVRVDREAAHTVSVAGLSIAYPAMNVAAVLLLALALLGAVSLARVGAAAYRVLRGQRALRRALRAAEVEVRSIDSVEVRVFAADSPEAFCCGFLRPSIHVSTTTLARLEPCQLRAVVAHESEHRRRRDPLRALAAHLAVRGLFFLPALGPLGRAGALRTELAADARAVRFSRGDVTPLAAAMAELGDVAPERVDQLLGGPASPQVPAWLVAVTGIIAAAAVALAWEAWRAASLHSSFALPLVSRQPCVLMLALVPAALLVGRSALSS